MFEELKERVCAANLDLVWLRWGLTPWMENVDK